VKQPYSLRWDRANEQGFAARDLRLWTI